jgi:hypothetical protein
MADLTCAPGIHMARVGPDIVLLDTAADRYSALPDLGEQIDPAPDGSVQASSAIAEELIALGLAMPGRPTPPRRAALPPRRELVPEPSREPTAIVRAAAILVASGLRFRRSTLATLLGPVAHGISTEAGERLEPVVAAARAAWPWIPLEGECLQRSFQLRSLLARHGWPVDWVFGVRTWPFAAHCWIQMEDRVLNDSLDRVRRYTPILTV